MIVLAVDDDPISLALLTAHLRQLGYTTRTADSLASARQACEDGRVRVIVADWKLGHEDGLELCRQLRLRGGDYVYFILLTQKPATDENIELAWAAGVDDFLVKPANARDLRMRIHVASRIVDYAKEVKQLKEIIPICSYCRKIRDDRDYWNQLENYIQDHTGSQFSHGICPDCLEQHILPELSPEERAAFKPPPKPHCD